MPLPDRTAAPAGPICLDPVNHALSLLGTAKRHQNLVQDDLVQYRETSGSQPFSKGSGLTAVALDQFPQPVSTQRSEGRPQFDSAGPAGGVRSELPRFASRAL